MLGRKFHWQSWKSVFKVPVQEVRIGTEIQRRKRLLGTPKEKGNTSMSVRRGDIYYADLSPVIGSEQGGLRPVLIIQNDIGNRYSPTVIAAAITSRMSKTRLPTHIDIYADEVGLAKDSVILLEQIRTLDKRRLKEKMGHLDDAVMDHVNTAIAISFGLGTPQQDAEARAMMQRTQSYFPRTSAAVASVATPRTDGNTTTPPNVTSSVDENGRATQVHNTEVK